MNSDNKPEKQNKNESESNITSIHHNYPSLFRVMHENFPTNFYEDFQLNPITPPSFEIKDG